MRTAGGHAGHPVLMICLAAAAALAVAPGWAQSSRTQRSFELRVDGAFLGITMDEVTADNMARYKLNSERGVIVRSVEKGSPAEEAGLRENDVILEFDGIPVLSAAQFGRMVSEIPPGRKVDLVVSREGKKLNITAKLKERSLSEPGPQVEVFPHDGSDRDFTFRFNRPPGRLFGFRTPEGEDRNFFYYQNPRGLEPGTTSEKPRLGITLQPLTIQLGEFMGVPSKKGALVAGVTDGSPAAGKLKAGDVIVRANDKAIEDPEDLIQLIRDRGISRLDLKVIRDKKEIPVTIDLPKEEGKSGSRGYKL